MTNEELFKQALVEGLNRRFDKAIEEAKKMEQIEEMTETINDLYGADAMYYGVDSYGIATALYNAGYRKQSEGHWIIDRTPIDATFECSECGYSYIEADPQAETEYKFCPYCGARMKGGE